MNEKQKKFLNELGRLLRKYGISRVFRNESDVMFMSNSESLAFYEYINDKFLGLSTTSEEYEVEEDEQSNSDGQTYC